MELEFSRVVILSPCVRLNKLLDKMCGSVCLRSTVLSCINGKHHRRIASKQKDLEATNLPLFLPRKGRKCDGRALNKPRVASIDRMNEIAVRW